MKNLRKLSFLLIAGLLVFVSSCSDNNSNTNSDIELIAISSVKSGDFTVQLESEKLLETGYNNLYWSVSKGNERVQLDSVTFSPIMDMTTMKHSCPKGNPTKSNTLDRAFETYAVFIMPSGEMGTWSISVHAYLSSREHIEADLPVYIANSWRLQSATINDTKYFVSWVSPVEPFVGKNTVKLMLHKKMTMMSFPSTDDFALSMYPFMDMGAGEGHSAPFEQLTAKGNGVFEGSISYSMSGDWQITVTLGTDPTTTKDVVFNMNVISK